MGSPLPGTRREFLQTAIGLGAATGLAAAGFSSSQAHEPAANAPSANGRKKLIAWGGIDWYSPEKVQTNIRTIEELPFDGMVLQGFKTSRPDVLFDWVCFGQERFERDDLAPAIATLSHIDFQRFTHNLLRFNVTPGDVDWFDDFSSILHNARLWAETARETGMQGWLFDIEDYKGTVFNYAKMKYRERKSFEEYARQAQLRGREFMEAVQDAFPEIVLLLALAHSYVQRAPQAGSRLAELEYGLVPAFINGLIEAAGPQVRIIDGHEQAYGYLTAEDYFRGYHATRQTALELTPPHLHSQYRSRMEAAMAVYVNYALALEGVAVGPPKYLSPADRLQLFEHNVYYALTAADEYAWCYGERIGWWEEGYPVPLPAGALDALRSARDKVQRNEPLGFDMTERVAAARQALAEAG